MGSFSNGPNQNIPMTTAMVPAIIAVHAPVPVARFHNSPPRIGTNKPPTRKSYSKIFSPGARVGWIAAPQPVRERLQVACESVCITPSVLAQELVTGYVGTQEWREGLARQLSAYQQRCEAAVAAVRQYLPDGTSFLTPDGGFFLWLALPERDGGWRDVLELALQEKVVVIPGSGCYVEREPGTHVRIAFSAVDQDVINEGVARLAHALRETLG